MGYTDLVNAFVYKQPLLTAKFDALGENDAYIKGNGWGDGVKTIFFQASVPTGWTLVTGHNDRFLRVVSNTGGNIGGVDGGTTLVLTGIVLAHNHSSISDVNHNHSLNAHTHNMASGPYGSNSIGTNVPVGIGDQVVDKYVSVAGSGAETGAWKNSFNSAILDVTAISSNGTHTHTVNSSLGTISPAYVDVIIGSKNTSSGYTDMTNFFSHNDKIKFEEFALVAGLFGNDEYNKGRITPAGTVGIFYQSAALQGWTKLLTMNDKALRVVSGAGGGSGGSLGTSQTIVLNHNHSVTAAGSHNHSGANHRHNVASQSLPAIYSGVFFWMIVDGSSDLRPTNNSGAVATAVKGRTTVAGGGTLTTDADHTHTLNGTLTNINFSYFDTIQCSKNSTGAPYAYEDLTSTVLYKKLVSKQKLDKFAKNDAYLKYHTMPAGAIMSFYQSATPTNWVLITTQHDKVLRITSGAGGGTGGTFLISNPITLVHTHSISDYSHSHTLPAHTHVFDTVSQATGIVTANRYIMSPGGVDVTIGTNTGVFGATIKNLSTNVSASTTSYSHNHGTSSSALSNITFAYSNVMLAQKA